MSNGIITTLLVVGVLVIVFSGLAIHVHFKKDKYLIPRRPTEDNFREIENIDYVVKTNKKEEVPI